MATSGTIYGSCTGGNGGKYDFWASWVRNSYSVDNGTSNITVSLKVQRNDGYSASAFNLDSKPSVSLKVNGSSKTPNTSVIDTRNGKVCTFATWTGNVTHKDDGSLTCPIVASFSLSGVSSLTGGSLSGNAVLDDIPRASTVSVSGTKSMGSAITISISRKSTSFTHDLTYTFGSASGSIKNGVATSHPWTIPDLASYCNNATKGTMVITCTTKNGTKTIGTSTVTFQVSVPAATTPTMASSATMGNYLRIVVSGKGSANFKHKISYSIGTKSLVEIRSNVTDYIDWDVPTSLASETGNKKSASCTITCVTYNGTAVVGTTTKSVTLNTPAASSFTIDKTSVNFGDTINISISRSAEAYTHKLTYSLTPKGESASVATGTIGTSIDATKPWKVEEALAKEMAAYREGTLTVTCTTLFKDGGNEVGESTPKSVTVTVPDNTTFQPKIDSVVLSCVSGLKEKFAGLYIAGKTKVKVKTTATSDYSTVKSISVKVEGRSYSGSVVTSTVEGKDYSESEITSDYLLIPGTNEIAVTVTDARGYSSVRYYLLNVIEYADPRIIPVSGESGIVCKRCTSTGKPSISGGYLLIKAQRAYSKVISDTQKNFCRLKYRYKTSLGESFSEWKNLLDDGDTTDAFDGKVGDVVLSTKNSYVVEICAEDDIEEEPVPLSFKVSTAFVTLHLGKGGKRVAIGKMAEEDNLFDVGIDSRFEGNVRGRVVGLGKLPAIQSGDNLDALVEPGVYAIKTHTAAEGILNLPEPSAGVVRVWSANGTGNTSGNWVYITQEYIPLGASSIYRRALQTEGTGTWEVGDWYKFSGTKVT